MAIACRTPARPRPSWSGLRSQSPFHTSMAFPPGPSERWARVAAERTSGSLRSASCSRRTMSHWPPPAPAPEPEPPPLPSPPPEPGPALAAPAISASPSTTDGSLEGVLAATRGSTSGGGLAITRRAGGSGFFFAAGLAGSGAVAGAGEPLGFAVGSGSGSGAGGGGGGGGSISVAITEAVACGGSLQPWGFTVSSARTRAAWQPTMTAPAAIQVRRRGRPDPRPVRPSARSPSSIPVPVSRAVTLHAVDRHPGKIIPPSQDRGAAYRKPRRQSPTAENGDARVKVESRRAIKTRPLSVSSRGV